MPILKLVVLSDFCEKSWYNFIERLQINKEANNFGTWLFKCKDCYEHIDFCDLP